MKVKFLLITFLLLKVCIVNAVDYVPPTSNVSSGNEGYKFPCSLNQITDTNLDSLSYVGFKYDANNPEGNPFDLMRSKLLYRVGSLGPTPTKQNFSINDLMPSGSNSQDIKIVLVPHQTKITVNCAPDTYVFQFSTNTSTANSSQGEFKRSFNLICNNGSLEREDKNAFCDKRCDILPLKNLNYKILQNNSYIYPGQVANIGCPTGFKTIDDVDSFDVTCNKNGFIDLSSPRCLNQNTSCVFQGKRYEEGFRLQCSGNNDFGIVIVSCEKGKWIRPLQTCNDNCFNSCKASFEDISFQYENLNDVIDIEIDKILTPVEVENYCKDANGEIKEECKAKKEFCKYDGKEYAQETEITLQCSDAQRYFICYGKTFVHNPNAYGVGENLFPISITDDACNNASLTEVKTPNSDNVARAILDNKFNRDIKFKIFRSRIKESSN